MLENVQSVIANALAQRVALHRMPVPIGVRGHARGSPEPNHWFEVVDDRDTSGGLFILHGWDGRDDLGRRFEFDDWVESLEHVETYFEQLPWRVEWQAPPGRGAPR